jgi:hypothetical protein
VDPDLQPRAARRLAWVAFLLALAAVPVLLFAPLGVVGYQRPSLNGEPPEPQRIERYSLVETEGWTLLPVLLVPVALSLIPVLGARTAWARKTRFAIAGLLTVFSVLLMISVGWAYLPAAAAMWIAATFPEGSSAPTRTAVP